MSLLSSLPEDPAGDWPAYDSDLPEKPAFPWPEEVAMRRRSQTFDEADLWRWAEQDYGDGNTAQYICDFYNLSRSTFTKRARREGFRRLDQRARLRPAGGLLTPETCEDRSDIEPPPAAPTPALADLAWRSMAEAMQRGDALDAQRWMKLASALNKQVKDQELAAKTRAVWIERGLMEPDPAPEDAETDTDEAERRSLGQENEGENAPFVSPHPDPLPQAGEGEEIGADEPLSPWEREGPAPKAWEGEGDGKKDDPLVGLERAMAVMLAKLEAEIAAGRAKPEVIAALADLKAQQAELAVSRRDRDADYAEAEALLAELQAEIRE